MSSDHSSDGAKGIALELLEPPARQTAVRTILITGGAGFIGSHLAERFAGDHKLVLLDNFHRDSLTDNQLGFDLSSVRLVRGDILDPSSVATALEGVDTVIHLAALAGVSSYYRQPLRTLETNLLGTVNLLRACAKAQIRDFIHFSTSEVFGSDAVFVTETSPCGIGPSSDRRWAYATSKLAGEQFSLRTAEEHGFRAHVVRPFNVYGPRQTGEGAISNFVAAAVNRQPLTIHGDGSEIRAWCYVTDLVDAVAAMLDVPLSTNECFNVGNPHAVETTVGLAHRVARLAGGGELEFQEVTRASVRARIPDITKANEVLGFAPKVDLDDGIARTLEWFRSRGGSK